MFLVLSLLSIVAGLGLFCFICPAINRFGLTPIHLVSAITCGFTAISAVLILWGVVTLVTKQGMG